MPLPLWERQPRRLPRSGPPKSPSCAVVELLPVVICVDGTTPKLLTLSGRGGEALPAGYLDDVADRTLEQAVRRRVTHELGLPVRYFEQLYTFGNRGRVPGQRSLAVAYLALARHEPVRGAASPAWRSCYELFPWEDWRGGRPAVLDTVVLPAIEKWLSESPPPLLALRTERAELTFGIRGARWDPVRVLDRYELAYEVGLVPEAGRDAGATSRGHGPLGGTAAPTALGVPLAFDHRRVAAAALERLRGKLAYRPVVFEVLPEAFTLSTLQQVVEAFAGQHLHKQNFRRLVAAANLVEPTGQSELATGGRPAELYRFRREVLRERPAPGLGLRRLGGV